MAFNYEKLAEDFKNGLTTEEMCKRHKLSRTNLHNKLFYARKKNLISKKETGKTSDSPADNATAKQYRTIRFKDGFTVAIAKSSTAKLVVNEKGNILII